MANFKNNKISVYPVKKIQRFDNVSWASKTTDYVCVPSKALPCLVQFEYKGQLKTIFIEEKESYKKVKGGGSFLRKDSYKDGEYYQLECYPINSYES